VNHDSEPILIESPHFVGRICMRVNGFKGVMAPLENQDKWATSPEQTHEVKPTSDYFTGKRRCFSLQIQGKFKQTWTGDDVCFGIVFDHKLSLPTGADIALKIAKVSQSLIDSEKRSLILDCKRIFTVINHGQCHRCFAL